jgi:putative heme iron utilization protein
MNPDLKATLQSLLASPVAALGTLRDGAPFVSMVPVAPDAEGLLIHVSGLAAHTRDLRADARMSLLFMAPLEGDANPLALPRLTLQGEAKELDRDSEEHDAAAQRYLARFPQAEQTLGLGDFAFFLLRPHSGRLVAGFGQALSLGAQDLIQGLPR